MKTTEPGRIGIVGGGMVGAFLALMIARNLQAVSVTLFDRHPPEEESRASFDGRSTAMAPTTEACFKQLGLWPIIAPYATPIHRIHVSDKGHMGMGLFDQSDNQGAPLGQVVANQGLGKALLAALNREALINCIQGDVTGLSMVQSGADITWQDDHGGQQANFDLVIIADGAQSKLRQQLGIGVTRIDYQQHAIVANVRHSNAHQLQAFERFTERGPLALLPRGGNALSRESGLVWTCPTDELAAYKAMTSAQLLTRLQQQFGFRLGHFSAISSPSFYPLELIVADEQVRSNLVLMGNAAHFLHPVAGQGFNLSVRDSLRLVGVLQQALNNNKSLGSLEVLQHYQQKQAQDQYNTIGLSDAFNRIFTHATLPIQIMRTLGLLGLELSPTLRSHFIALLSGRAQAAI